ncbi:MAG: hypothetical protein AAF479_17990, partial [Pseudomonadota bacterium]
MNEQTPTVRLVNPAETAANTVALELEGTTVEQLVRTVLGDELGYSIVTVGDLSAPISWSSAELEPDEAQRAVEAVVTQAGYAIRYAGRAAIVSAEGTGDASARAFVPMNNATPGGVVVAIREAYPDLSVSIAGRSVVLAGQSGDVAAAAEFVTALDVDQLSDVPWAVVRLPREIASQAASIVQTLAWNSEADVTEVYALEGTGLVFVAGYSNAGVEAAVTLLRSIGKNVSSQVVRTVQVNDAEAAAEALELLYRTEVGEGTLSVAPLVSASSVSVRGEPQTVAEVVRYLEGITTPQDWVSVQAVLAETQAGSAIDRGISFQLASGNFTFGGGFGGVDPAGITDTRAASIGVEAGGFRAAIAWLETDVKTDILSRPSISVRSGIEASLSVGSEVPILETQVTDTEDGDSLTQSITYRETGVLLTVTPRVLRDGRIAITVVQEFSNAVANTFSTVDSPVFDQRALTTEVVVVPGETAILAGL